jgi:hypothetical protein
VREAQRHLGRGALVVRDGVRRLALDRETEETTDEAVLEMGQAVDESTATVLAAIEDLKAQVVRLETRLDGERA